MSGPKVSYYLIRAPYPKKNAVVVAVHTDGSTTEWKFGDKGFNAAYDRAQRANSNKRRGR